MTLVKIEALMCTGNIFLPVCYSSLALFDLYWCLFLLWHFFSLMTTNSTKIKWLPNLYKHFTVLKVHFKKRSAKDLFDDVHVIFFWLYKSMCCGYSSELHQLVIPTAYNFIKQTKSTLAVPGNLKTTELLVCALIGVCAVISLNMVNGFLWRHLENFNTNKTESNSHIYPKYWDTFTPSSK